MKKVLAISLCLVLGVSLLTGCGDSTEKKEKATTAAKVTNKNELKITDVFTNQKEVDNQLKTESEKGYTLDEPAVIVNPYGTSPLSAVIIFDTEEEIGGEIIVKGKDEKDNISGKIEKAKKHIIPVYGLYNNAATQIEIKLDNGETKTVEATTEDINFDTGKISVDMKNAEKYDYGKTTLVCSVMDCLYMLDSKGDIRWYYNNGGVSGVKQLKNGRLMTPTKFTIHPMYYKSGMQEIDYLGKVYTEYAIPGGLHHDVVEMKNGNYLVASDSPDFSSVEDYLVEIDKETGEVVWELDMKDLLDVTDGESASTTLDGTDKSDWYHNNGIAYDEENDLILMSARHVDAIVAVEKSTKQLKWILGNPDGWTKVDKKYFFTPVGDEFEWQYAQHQVTILENGDVMLFDNGTAKVKAADIDSKVEGDDVYSRAVVYDIDTEKMTIEQVWQYGKERGPEWYSDWISGSISLDGTSNNVWITAGSNLYNEKEDSHDYGNQGMFIPGLIRTTHLNQVVDNKLVYELKISGETNNALTYRTLRVNMYDTPYDIDSTGEILGSLGTKDAADVEMSEESLKSAESAQNCVLTYDRTKITLTTAYTAETGTELKDSYIIFVDGNKKARTFDVTQSSIEQEGKVAASVTGWVSPESLETGEYDVYVSLNGTVYNTGYFVNIAK